MNKHERSVRALFSERFGLDLRKIPEADVPTPDFDVYAGLERIAVLEVKALESTARILTIDQVPEDDVIEGSLSVDNCAGRVAKKIHEAVSQFEGATVPRIVVLLNNGAESDKFDLQEALRGYLSYGDEKVTTLVPDALRRMTTDRAKIDLCAWMDEAAEEDLLLVTTSADGRALRARYFEPQAAGGAG